jgi:hypothetical protein
MKFLGRGKEEKGLGLVGGEGKEGAWRYVLSLYAIIREKGGTEGGREIYRKEKAGSQCTCLWRDSAVV